MQGQARTATSLSGLQPARRFFRPIAAPRLQEGAGAMRALRGGVAALGLLAVLLGAPAQAQQVQLLSKRAGTASDSAGGSSTGDWLS